MTLIIVVRVHMDIILMVLTNAYIAHKNLTKVAYIAMQPIVYCAKVDFI